MPGKTMGQALTYLNSLAKQYLPKTTQVNYADQSRQFIQEGNVLLYAFPSGYYYNLFIISRSV